MRKITRSVREERMVSSDSEVAAGAFSLARQGGGLSHETRGGLSHFGFLFTFIPLIACRR